MLILMLMPILIPILRILPPLSLRRVIVRRPPLLRLRRLRLIRIRL